MKRALAFAMVCFLFAQTSLVAQPLQAADESPPPFDLSKVQAGDAFSGLLEARRLLEQNGFVVTDEQFKQIFEAYVTSPGPRQSLPKFVTTDSVWHTYHVLFEAGIRQLEERQAAVLADFSQRLYRQAWARRSKADGGDAGQIDIVYNDLALFAAVGWAIQRPEALKELEEAERAVVEQTISLLRQGDSPGRVLFFGLPATSDRYRAVSFYARTPWLADYFVARQWYATTAFRLDSDVETERAIRLALLVHSDEKLDLLHQQLEAPYEALLGPADDSTVIDYIQTAAIVFGENASHERITAGLDDFRTAAADLPAPQVNDQLLDPLEYPRFAELTKGFRLFPPRRLPSAVLFMRTVDPIVKGRMFPSGIDVFATGPLASEAGRAALEREEAPTVAAAVLDAQPAPLPDSLHGQTLRLLTQLQAPLPAAAPKPLQTRAWRDKQLWTQSGAWAEQRHTWALHAKLTRFAYGRLIEPPGYVSPYPEFFRGMARLTRETALALRLEKNGGGARDEFHADEADPTNYFDGFARVCDRLAEIADRQLAGQSLDESDAEFIKDYGVTLAKFHFYDGDSYSEPRDDFPTAVPIFSSPLGNHEQLLYGGLGRPEAVYVIIDVQGKPTLHRGAVLSYREFRRPTVSSIDDDDWAQMVRRGEGSSPPEFTASFRRVMGERELIDAIRDERNLPQLLLTHSPAVTSAMIEALIAGHFTDESWFRTEALRSASDEHVASLLVYLDKLSASPGNLRYEIRNVVRCLEKLNCSPYRERLFKLLHHEAVEVVDAAAYLLSKQPGEFDVEVLTVHYEPGKPAAQRLVCYLLGRSAAPHAKEAALLHRGLVDESAAVRHQAILAMLSWHQAGVDLNRLSPRLIEQLLKMSRDDNPIVRTAATQLISVLEEN